MPGMGGGGLTPDNPAIVAAFHTALREQALIVVLVAVLAFVLWRPVALAGRRRLGLAPVTAQPEPPARRVLRVAFGALWMLDGVLQTQQALVLGLPDRVIRPAEAGAPSWVHAVVTPALGVWARHPVAAATSVVWIQLAVGALLLVAPRWSPSRAAGGLSAGWAVAVWVFGEAFGGLLSPGASWLFGLPGAASLYLLAGIVLALPAAAWRGRRLGRALAGGIGAGLVAMAVLQAWPGRGFWEGGKTGQLPAMFAAMARTPQPAALVAVLRAAAGFASADAWVVNLCAVAALATVGVGLLAAVRAGRRRALLAAVATGEVLCLAAWVVVQDLGVLGGVGTDPNSMLPTALVLLAAAVAATPGAGTAAGAAAPSAVAARRDGAPPAATAASPAVPTSSAATAPDVATSPVATGPAVATLPAAAGGVAPGAPQASPVGVNRVWRAALALPTATVAATVAAGGMLLVGAVPATDAAVSPGRTPLVASAPARPAVVAVAVRWPGGGGAPAARLYGRGAERFAGGTRCGRPGGVGGRCSPSR